MGVSTLNLYDGNGVGTHTIVGCWVNAWDLAVLVHKQCHALLPGKYQATGWGHFGCRGQGLLGICLDPTKILPLGSLPLPSLALLLPNLPAPKGSAFLGLLPSGEPLLPVPTAQLFGFCPGLLTDPQHWSI